MTDWPLRVISASGLGRVAEAHAVIASTNTRAMELASGGAPHGALVIADSQSGGRGRLGRTWSAPPGLNIYMSIVLREGLDMPLPIIAGVACHSALVTLSGAEIALKWPNDLMAVGRKLGGILEEGRATSAGSRFAVIGIGINVNATAGDIPPELRDLATSLLIATGRAYDRSAVLNAVLSALDAALGSPREETVARYRKACSTIGREVRAITAGGDVEGVAADVADDGRLLIRRGGGEIVAVSAGDIVHLR